MSWKDELFWFYEDRAGDIGRADARHLNVPWATVWDFKQKILSGEITAENYLTKPKILLLDIETAPILAHVWGLWQNNVSLNQMQQDWYMLSWSAKWLDDDSIYSDNLFRHEEDFRQDPCNDYNIVKSLYDMIDEADFIIGHNVKKFDDKKFKARALYHGMQPLSSYRVIDTLAIAKREFALTSNKLDFLATHLGFENKLSHEGHTLWTKCIQGDPEAWGTMQEYNDYDVILLEDVYKAIRAWYKPHPNVAVYYNDFHVRCTTCGSKDVTPTGGTAKTNASKFAEYSCGNCGKISRDGVTQLSKEKRSSLLRNIT